MIFSPMKTQMLIACQSKALLGAHLQVLPPPTLQKRWQRYVHTLPEDLPVHWFSLATHSYITLSLRFQTPYCGLFV
jgi:hypothetical protein